MGLSKDSLSRPRDLDKLPAGMNVSNGTFARDGRKLCRIILKSMLNCRSYSQDKFGRPHAH